MDDVCWPLTGHSAAAHGAIIARLRAAMQSGVLQLGREATPHWSLHQNNGSRSHLETIHFDPPFPDPPVVLAFIAGFRASNNADIRLAVEPTAITAAGFSLKVGTWSNSSVDGCDVTWVAMAVAGAAFAGKRAILSRFGAACKSAPTWNLDKGKGERVFTQQVKFSPADAFTKTPMVFCGLSLIDIVNDADYRLSVTPANLTRVGLDLVVSTWRSTHIWSAHVSWIAFDESYARSKELSMSTGRIPFKNTLPQYSLHQGNGPRNIQQQVIFSSPFAEQPAVVPALVLIDLLCNTPTCVRVRATSVSGTGCAIELSTQDTALVWGTACAWLAHSKPKAAAAAVAPAPAAAVSPAPAAATMLPEMGKLSITETKENDICKICFDAKINTVVIPCGHIALCWECSKLIKGPGKKNECTRPPQLSGRALTLAGPICKGQVADIIKTYAA